MAILHRRLNGGPIKPVNYFHTDAQHYNAIVIMNADDGLVSGKNVLTLVVRDFDRPSNTGTASTPFTYQIKPIPALSQVDIVPTAFEVTQSISDGPHGLGDVFLTDRGFEVYVIALFDVPLLQGKPTVIRIYGEGTTLLGLLSGVPKGGTVMPARLGVGTPGELHPFIGGRTRFHWWPKRIAPN